MTVSKKIRDMVEARIVADVDKINAHFNENLIPPPTCYDVKGKTAGYVTSRDNHRAIHLNAVLLTENIDEMVNQTTPHELAHWAERKIYGGWERIGYGRKRSVHGQRWKAIMSVLDVDADRCHSMDTSNAQVRVKNKFEYKCSGCGHLLTVGPVVHKKIQRGDHRWHKGCGSSTKIEYVGKLGQVTYAEAKEARKPTRAPASPKRPKLSKKVGSKKDRAQTIFNNNRLTHGRDGIVKMFMEQLDMTKAGANTYWYNCSKAA